MVGLSTKARLISASATPSPSRTVRTTSRTRWRSTATISCGVAMAILPMTAPFGLSFRARVIVPRARNDRRAPSARPRDLVADLRLQGQHADLPAVVDLDAGAEHRRRRRLAEHLAPQREVVVRPVAGRRVLEDRLPEA